MEKYEALELEIIAFGAENVIITSDPEDDGTIGTPVI